MTSTIRVARSWVPSIEVLTSSAQPAADLSITKTDGVTTTTPGATLTYTITVSNAGPDAVTGATVVDNLPAGLTGTNLNTTVNLAPGASQTFTVTATVSAERNVVGVEHGNGDRAGQRQRSVDGQQLGDRYRQHRWSSADADGARQLQPGQRQLLGSQLDASLRASARPVRCGSTPTRRSPTATASPLGTFPLAGSVPSRQRRSPVANTTVNGDSLVLKANRHGDPDLGGAAELIRVRYNAGTTQIIVDYTTNFRPTTPNGGVRRRRWPTVTR